MLNHLHLFSQQLKFNYFLGVFDSFLIPQEVQSLFFELFGPDGLLIVNVRPLIFGGLLLLNLKISRDLFEKIVETVAQLVIFLVVDGGEQFRIGFF